jgi:type II secretory pathway pseudopilin PulG
MKKSSRPGQGITLVELVVAMAVLLLFMGMVAWFAKGATDFRISSERKLKLLTILQRNMFLVENDLLSARRHTLGNVLCNNITVTLPGWSPMQYRMTSDPSFESDASPFTNNTNVRTAWYWDRRPLVPAGIALSTRYAEVRVDQSPAARLHGSGSLAVFSSLVAGSYFSVRSPDISDLTRQDYVLAGWVRGTDTGGAGDSITPQIVFQRDIGDGLPGNDIVVASPGSLNEWVYVTVLIPGAALNPTWTYNVYLRTLRNGGGTQMLAAHFDNITLTPVREIAQIDFASAITPPFLADGNYNLHNRNDMGMVFFVSNTTASGEMQEMKYIFSQPDLRTFPADKPDIQRFLGQIPRFEYDGRLYWPAQPSPPYSARETLTNISQLNVSWVGDWSLGANRSILVALTVRDPDDPTKTLTLERTLLPPTD